MIKKFTAIGVDVGGTKIAAGIVDFPGGVVRARRTIPTLPKRGGEAVLADVARLMQELASELEVDHGGIDGIGVGICEIVGHDGTIASANCLDWKSSSLQENFKSIAPVVIEADVRAAALAEAIFGAEQNAGDFLYISIGTGIASCLVIDGRPYTGARGATGTMASGPMPCFDAAGRAAHVPTLEQIASGPALVLRFQALGGKAQSGNEVLAEAAAGNMDAIQVVESAAEILGGTIGWMVNILDPARVILGGGLGGSSGLFQDTVIKSARRHIWWEGHRDLSIVQAATGADAGMIGAAATAWKRFGEK